MAENISPGTSVWVQEQGEWLPGDVSVLKDEKECVVNVHLPDGTSKEVCAAFATLHLRSQQEELVEDLTSLTHLHEPGVLHSLNARYKHDFIYTNTGGILIAVNPFKQIPGLLGPEIMKRYQEQLHSPDKDNQRLAPHVYDTAVRAYKQMLQDGAGQAILITGESGAGKTETCKLIMRCLAHLGGQGTDGSQTRDQAGHGAGISVEQKVLESNPLLEAFGNAKTSRNDNSSRFGKYVEIQFGRDGKLLGAAIRTYLLERSRVVAVVNGERTFHAFYQLCAGASPEERAAWHIGQATDFSLLCQSDCKQLPGVDDAEEFMHTKHAMTAVGLDGTHQQEIFATLAAILHLCNITWEEPSKACPAPAALEAAATEGGGEAGSGQGAAACWHEAPRPETEAGWQALQWAADLLQVPSHQLLAVIVTVTRNTPDGRITSPLTATAAGEACKALCKAIYARLFTHIVDTVNSSLEQHKNTLAARANGSSLLEGAVNGASTPVKLQPAGKESAAATAPGGSHKPVHRVHSTSELEALPGTPSKAALQQQQQGSYTIGLLDIYGFESFEINDLEQMCINLANEKLQQHFNQHVFKWEQAEYVREGVDWRFIEFVDNQDVLDLVEGKLGLLDLLDEQCRFPKNTSQDLAYKYSSTPSVANSKRFSKQKRSPTGFVIEHYAGSVVYSTENFLDKNKDYVVAEHAALLAASRSGLVAALFESKAPTAGRASETDGRSSASKPPAGGGASFKFDSIASQFKRQLADLMATLHVMQPHYVRCIKPSPANKPGLFNKAYALNQLRCGGVMEAVRISCAGFAYKRPFHAFLDYFWPLCPSALHHAIKQGRSRGLTRMTSMLHSHSEGDLTKTKVDLSQIDTEILKEATKQVLAAAGVEGYVGLTKLFLKSSQAATLEKQRGRIFGTAATRVQAWWKGVCARRKYKAIRHASVQLQTAVRAYQARQLHERMRRQHASLVLQSQWRSRTQQRRLRMCKEAATCIQSACRALHARRELHKMERERAALLLQCVWRSKLCQRQLKHDLQQHKAAQILQACWRSRKACQDYRRMRAAQILQACWRGRQARQQYQSTLRFNRAAMRIQSAWRGQRKGEQIRDALRTVVYEAVEQNRAAVVLQTAWRQHSERQKLDKLKTTIKRRKFAEQLQRFQSASTDPPAPALRTRRSVPHTDGAAPDGTALQSAGSGELIPSRSMSRRTTHSGGGSLSHRASSTNGTLITGEIVRELDDVDMAEAGDITEARRIARTKELKSFKLNPLLEFWKTREQAVLSKTPVPTIVGKVAPGGRRSAAVAGRGKTPDGHVASPRKQ